MVHFEIVGWSLKQSFEDIWKQPGCRRVHCHAVTSAHWTACVLNNPNCHPICSVTRAVGKLDAPVATSHLSLSLIYLSSSVPSVPKVWKAGVKADSLTDCGSQQFQSVAVEASGPDLGAEPPPGRLSTRQHAACLVAAALRREGVCVYFFPPAAVGERLGRQRRRDGKVKGRENEWVRNNEDTSERHGSTMKTNDNFRSQKQWLSFPI